MEKDDVQKKIEQKKRRKAQYLFVVKFVCQNKWINECMYCIVLYVLYVLYCIVCIVLYVFDHFRALES